MRLFFDDFDISDNIVQGCFDGSGAVIWLASEVTLKNVGYNRPEFNHNRTWTVCMILVMIKWRFFCVTGPLWGESTRHRCIPLTKTSDAVLWYFLLSAPEQGFKQTIETRSLWRHYNVMMCCRVPCVVWCLQSSQWETDCICLVSTDECR